MWGVRVPSRASCLLIVVTLAAWGGVLLGSFHYDDFANIVRDPATADPSLLAGRLLTGVRPLLRASYMLDHALWGFRASGFLLTNLVIHIATVLGVHALASARLRDPAGALMAALAFALQPASAEVVAWVSGRSTGLATALIVAGLAVHGGADSVRQVVQNPGGSRGPARHTVHGWRAAIAGSLFALACMAKETALVFPFLLLLWDWTRKEDEEPGALRPPTAFAVAFGSLGLMALSARYRELLGHSLDLRDPTASLAVNVRALPRLLSLWVRPSELSIVQPFDPASPGRGAAALGIALVASLLCGLALRRRAPIVALAAGWILIALAPTHSLIARIEVISAKALYTAWIGPALALGAAAIALRARLGTGRARTVATATVIALLISLGGLAVVREVGVWSSEVALWERAIRLAPRDAVAWNDYGAALLAAGRPPEAIEAFRVALSLDPGNARTRMNLSTAAVLCGTGCEGRF